MGSTARIPHAVPPAGSQRAQPINSGVMLLYEHRYVLIYGFETHSQDYRALGCL